MSLYDTNRTARDEENDAQMEAEAAAWNKAHARLSQEMTNKGIDAAVTGWDDQTVYFDIPKDDGGDQQYAEIASILGVSAEEGDRSEVNNVLEERFRELYQLYLAAQ